MPRNIIDNYSALVLERQSSPMFCPAGHSVYLECVLPDNLALDTTPSKHGSHDFLSGLSGSCTSVANIVPRGSKYPIFLAPKTIVLMVFETRDLINIEDLVGPSGIQRVQEPMNHVGGQGPAILTSCGCVDPRGPF